MEPSANEEFAAVTRFEPESTTPKSMTSDSGDEIPDMPLALSPCGRTDFAGKINRFALLVTKNSSVSSAATVKATILSPSFRPISPTSSLSGKGPESLLTTPLVVPSA